jgi:hypothetical protein
MATTDFFKRALYLQRNSVADEYYDRSNGFVSEKEADKAGIEVRLWSDMYFTAYRRKPEVQTSCPERPGVAAAECQFAEAHTLTLDLPKEDSTTDTTVPTVVGGSELNAINTDRRLAGPDAARYSTFDLNLARLRDFLQVGIQKE